MRLTAVLLAVSLSGCRKDGDAVARGLVKHMVIAAPPGARIKTRARDDRPLRSLPPGAELAPLTAAELEGRLPPLPEGRLLPRPDGATFFQERILCFDGGLDAATLAGRLAASGWKELSWSGEGAIEISAVQEPYLLSGFLQPGDRAECTQTLLALAVRKLR